MHDFQWYCPRVVLVDQTEQYCREPGAQYCQLCVRANPIYDFGEAEALIRADLPAWIARNAALLERAQIVVAPSRDTAARMAAHFPLSRLRYAAHPETVPRAVIGRAADADRQTRIAVVGGINVAKGREVLRNLALHIDASGAPVRIKVIGTIDAPDLFADIASISIDGSYHPEELPDLLARFDPHFVFFPAIWPETYSFALSEIWAAGYPALAFDIGAIAERIRTTGAGMVIPFDSSPIHLLARLLEARGKLARLAGLAFKIGRTGSFADDPVADLFRAAVRSPSTATASTKTGAGKISEDGLHGGNGLQPLQGSGKMNGSINRLSPSASEAVVALLARAGLVGAEESVNKANHADEHAKIGVEAANLLAGWDLADLSEGVQTSPQP